MGRVAPKIYRIGSRRSATSPQAFYPSAATTGAVALTNAFGNYPQLQQTGVEQLEIDGLGGNDMFTVDADQPYDGITLDGDGVSIEFLDQEIATPDADLTDGTWTVDSIVSGDGPSGSVMSARWDDPATLTFEEDGSLGLFTGCAAGDSAMALVLRVG